MAHTFEDLVILERTAEEARALPAADPVHHDEGRHLGGSRTDG
ncbi:hypothetical protein ACWDBD_47600 [Streptomyces sp. NPDC001118]